MKNNYKSALAQMEAGRLDATEHWETIRHALLLADKVPKLLRENLEALTVIGWDDGQFTEEQETAMCWALDRVQENIRELEAMIQQAEREIG